MNFLIAFYRPPFDRDNVANDLYFRRLRDKVDEKHGVSGRCVLLIKMDGLGHNSTYYACCIV